MPFTSPTTQDLETAAACSHNATTWVRGHLHVAAAGVHEVVGWLRSYNTWGLGDLCTVRCKM